jgi:nucleotide-binding universal stress UspA family protein
MVDPDQMRSSHMTRIVVGVDGSPTSRKALAFAAQEARMRDATLEVVHVRPPARMTGLSSSFGVQAEYLSADMFTRAAERDREQVEEAENEARRAVENMLHAAIADVDLDASRIEQTILVDRRPARRLVELVNERDDVELLVVGSRGLGELSGALLGSVSQACVTHARVPVTVIPRSR